MSHVLRLGAPVRVGLAHATVGKLAHARPIRKQNVLLPIGELDCLNARLLNALDGPIGEDGLLLTILKDALYRTVRESKDR